MSIVNNRKARFDYHVEENLEAGIMLEGWEVKAIRAGKVQLTEAYVKILSGVPTLIGCHVTPLLAAQPGADPTRSRRLLLRAIEIERLSGKVEQRGMTLVPLELYYKRGMVKLRIGLAKGKNTRDKRQATRERELDREVRRELK